jgi:hypothetical protein
VIARLDITSPMEVDQVALFFEGLDAHWQGPSNRLVSSSDDEFETDNEDDVETL